MFNATLPQSLYGLLPGRATGALRDKTAKGNPDTFSAPRAVTYRKLIPNRNQILRASLITTDIITVFQIIDDGTDGGFLPPQSEGRFIDSAGAQWMIRIVEDRIMETLHTITCTKCW